MWYAAKLIFDSDVDEQEEPSIREASIRLIHASSDQEAMAKAVAIGQTAEHNYLNHLGETVYWRFIEVSDLQDLCEHEVTDGMEVYSTLERKSKR